MFKTKLPFPKSSLSLCCRTVASALAPENWKVFVGFTSLDKLPQPYPVKKIILSDNYNNKTNDEDVALIKLASPVYFNGQ